MAERELRACKVCGNMFVVPEKVKGKIYCSTKCRYKGISQRAKERKKGQELIRQKRKKEIARLEEEAREQGMTYGQYVGLKEYAYFHDWEKGKEGNE